MITHGILIHFGSVLEAACKASFGRKLKVFDIRIGAVRSVKAVTYRVNQRQYSQSSNMEHHQYRNSSDDLLYMPVHLLDLRGARNYAIRLACLKCMQKQTNYAKGADKLQISGPG